MSGGPSISVITPTISRPELARSIASVFQQGTVDGDEMIVVGDGPQPVARRMVEALQTVAPAGLALRYYEHGPTGYLGFAQRQFGMERAHSDLIAFLCDDDYYLPAAFSRIRAAAREYPDRLLMFRMRGQGSVVWRRPGFRMGNVSDQIFIAPNRPDRLGFWKGARYEGDYDWMVDTIAKYPDGAGAIAWIDELIAVFDDGGYGRRGEV